MFGLFGARSASLAAANISGTSSRRVQRAQRLRQQRLAAQANSGKQGHAPNNDTAADGGGAGGTGGGDDDEVLVVSGLCTILCAFLIVCLGAAMAAIFFMIYQPDCMKGVGSWGVADTASFASPDVQAKTITNTGGSGADSGLRRSMKELLTGPARIGMEDEDVVQAAAAAAVAASDSDTASSVLRGGAITTDAAAAGGGGGGGVVYMPPQCTASQLTTLAEQLPPGGCKTYKDRPWRRTACSFSMATSCNDPTWFHQHYAKAQLPADITFTSIHVGCNKGYQALDMLAIGNKDPEKYDWIKWRTAFLENAPEKVEDSADSCPHPDVYFEGSKFSVAHKAQAYCIEPVPKTFQRLQETKDKLGIGDELHLSQVIISNNANEALVRDIDPIGVESVGLDDWAKYCRGQDASKCTQVAVDSLDHWVTTAAPTTLGPHDPIHYLSLALQGHDYLALVGGAKTLNRVHYLDVQYHWYGDWGRQSLEDMITRLKRKHFVCYFAGDQNLWRITDCWQPHYQYKFYANLACVNTQLAEPLAKEMEAIFEKTLEKKLQFGDK